MSASQYLPAPSKRNLDLLRVAAETCKGCDLWENATQTVFGEGTSSSRIVLVGEQPGDFEDRTGEPFVGPAGKLLDRALAAADIDRRDVYVTNAVKHFKWEARGKRRIHKPPDRYEITACHPWLEAEIAAVQPELVVAMGATAVRSMLGKTLKIMEVRGKVQRQEGVVPIAVTVHPSSILRNRDTDAREHAFGEFVADLRSAAGEVMSRDG